MKTIFVVVLGLLSSSAFGWGPGGGPGWNPGWNPGWWPGIYGGMGYGGGGYAMSGMAMIQTPSFNYTTTIIQSPPIIINQTGEVLVPEPREYRGDTYQPGRYGTDPQ